MTATPLKGINYYVMYGDEQLGPYKEIEIRNLYEIGSITRSTKIWCDDVGDWVDLQEIPEFRSITQTG